MVCIADLVKHGIQAGGVQQLALVVRHGLVVLAVHVLDRRTVRCDLRDGIGSLDLIKVVLVRLTLHSGRTGCS